MKMNLSVFCFIFLLGFAEATNQTSYYFYNNTLNLRLEVHTRQIEPSENVYFIVPNGECMKKEFSDDLEVFVSLGSDRQFFLVDKKNPYIRLDFDEGDEGWMDKIFSTPQGLFYYGDTSNMSKACSLQAG